MSTEVNIPPCKTDAIGVGRGLGRYIESGSLQAPIVDGEESCSARRRGSIHTGSRRYSSASACTDVDRKFRFDPDCSSHLEKFSIASILRQSVRVVQV